MNSENNVCSLRCIGLIGGKLFFSMPKAENGDYVVVDADDGIIFNNKIVPKGTMIFYHNGNWELYDDPEYSRYQLSVGQTIDNGIWS